jgi:hypothetical protein
MTRTITDTADRLRTCDMLTLDSDLRKQTPVRLPNIVLVEGIAACATHAGCIAVAVADPHGSLGDQPDATLHIAPGYILTWTGDYSLVGCAGHRPGGVDLDRPAVVAEVVTEETPDITTTLLGIVQATSTLKDQPETYDTDTLWKFLQAITDAKKILDNELVQRMLAATKEG